MLYSLCFPLWDVAVMKDGERSMGVLVCILALFTVCQRGVLPGEGTEGLVSTFKNHE